ncbi:MAG: hypothetical protein SFX72_11020 [Isosphaeraceae bacterium]|nr:hypothetical protein [Isosphaeraceae bacterium]
MDRLRLATVWLGGCSGCHMSFLDLDEYLITLAEVADIVYCPIIDAKEYPRDVDVALVEGAVANEENREMLLRVRERTKFLIAFGDCAGAGNVTAMRNPLGDPESVLARSYVDTAEPPSSPPVAAGIVPILLPRVLPIHRVVNVDLFLQGCPPSAPRIRNVLEQIVAGRRPPFDDMVVRFG